MHSEHQPAQVPGHDTRIIRSFRASELFYRRLLETATEGILILDFDTGRIEDANPFLFELLGLSRAEMVGKCVGQLSAFRRLESKDVMRKRLQKSGQVRYENLPVKTGDGRNLIVEFTGHVFQASGKKIVQCHVRDLTERKHAEDEIRRLHAQLAQRVAERTTQIQSAKEELQAFGYIVSHDLRAPLRQVGGVVKQLQKDAGPVLSKKNRRHLAMISESAKIMGELIDDLLAFAQAGRWTSEKSEIDLDELIRETSSQAGTGTQERVGSLKAEPSPSMLPKRDLQEASEGGKRRQVESRRDEYSLKLQELSRRLVEAQETERRNIARELHDEIGQALTVTQMQLQEMLMSPKAQGLKPRLAESLKEVERILEQVQDISLDLRPSMLDDLGLEPALAWLTNRQAGLAGLKAEVRTDLLEQRLDTLIETGCFRIAQEALTNVVRHAHAHVLTVDLHVWDGELHLRVRDDGDGFDAAAAREKAVLGASLGLLSMEERAVLGGGGLEFTSGPGLGTEVHAWFPLKWRSAQT